MGAQSDYLDRAALRWAFEQVAFPSLPAALPYLALYTVAPTKAGGGTEVSGGSYARLATALADWAVSGPPYRVANARLLALGTPTVAWGTLVAYGLLDAPAAGNLLYSAVLALPRTPAVGQPVVFSIGTLTIQGS